MISLQRMIDKYIGGLLILFMIPFARKRQLQEPDRILIIKLWAIGDAILSTALIEGINKKYPKAKIDVLCRQRNQAVFKATKHVDRIFSLWEVPKIIGSYALVFDTEPYMNFSAIIARYVGWFTVGIAGQWRSHLYDQPVRFTKKKHMVQNYLEMLRILGHKINIKTLPGLDVREYKTITNFLREQGVKKKDLLIGISPGVAETAKNRMWYEERFARLADWCIEELNAKVIFIDSPNNAIIVHEIQRQMKHEAINSLGKFSLKRTFDLIGRCNIFIGNDSGGMHIAAAMGCRTIGLFGPNTPKLWGPYGKDNISIRKTKLKPGIDNFKPHFETGNREGYMGPISAEDVKKAVRKLK